MHGYVWSYPPHVVLLLSPLGLLPYIPAFVLWTLGGFALFLYAAVSGGVERPSTCCSWQSRRRSPSTCSSARTASSPLRC